MNFSHTSLFYPPLFKSEAAVDLVQMLKDDGYRKVSVAGDVGPERFKYSPGSACTI